jgi:hypothetical protein
VRNGCKTPGIIASEKPSNPDGTELGDKYPIVKHLIEKRGDDKRDLYHKAFRFKGKIRSR